MADLHVGDRGQSVRRLQQALAKLGYRLAADGIFGRRTLAAVQSHAEDRTRGGVRSWHVAAIHKEADARGGQARLVGDLTTVGAWCGATTLANPVRDVGFAVDHNINRLDLVVNDHSRSRAPRPFSIRSVDAIRRVCDLASARGIEVHLMSWVMPYADYIDQAAQALIPLAEQTGAASVQWDAEEPWTQATGGMRYTNAASHLKKAFSGLPCPMGATGIGYTPVKKFGPLAAVCDYLVPQAYSTTSSGLKPETAPSRFFERWSKAFGRPIVMGLAAYRQNGLPNHTVTSAIEVAAASAAEHVDSVVYWSLTHIRRSPPVARAIAGLLG